MNHMMSYEELETRYDMLVEKLFDRDAELQRLRIILENELKFNEMVQSANSIIMKFDPKFNFVFINEYGQSFFGYTEKELLGKNVIGTIVPELESTGRNLESMVEAIPQQPGAFIDNENENIRKDGQRVWIAWRNKVLANPDGTISGIISIGYDITDRKRAENNLEKAKVAAEAASVAKSDFLANMSHEIRTPMNGVIGMIDLMLETNLDPEQIDYAESLKSSAYSLLTLINDILDFSKIEAGKLDFEMINFDLRVTLEDLSEVIALKAAEKNLHFVLFIGNDVPTWLKGDPGRLKQILINLSGNAIKFTEDGEVSINVYVEKETKDRVLLRFDVTDTGIGIADQEKDKIFDSFTQADSSITRQYGGTGLGLSISKKLSEMMNGRIGLDSEKGKGSTFWFTAEFEKHSEANIRSYVPRHNLQNQKILIADSNVHSQQVFKEYISSWGCRTDMAQDAEQTFSRLKNEAEAGDPFNMLILEMRLADTNAVDIAKKIQAEPMLNKLTTVVVTAYGKRGDVSLLKKAGFSGFLTKPVRKQDLHDCLSTLSAPDLIGLTGSERPFITRYSLEEYRKKDSGLDPNQIDNKYPKKEDLSLRILLAEDNKMNQKVVTKMLEKLKFQVTTAENGKEAVKYFSEGDYDLILMDMQMPVMDGLEATIQIRKIEKQGSRIPIIACTANAMKEDRDRCLAAGMDNYISKPIQKNELFAIIEAVR